VTLNSHIDISRGSASNMRLFEATGVGSCLLTDAKSNLQEMFVSDQEVVTYRSVDECLEKASYLLEHEAVRAGIAAAGQRRTLADHTFAHRAVLLDEIIRRLLARGRAGVPRRHAVGAMQAAGIWLNRRSRAS